MPYTGRSINYWRKAHERERRVSEETAGAVG
jgi:hypothetical protein